MRRAKNVTAPPTLEAFLGRAGIFQIKRFDLGIVLLPGSVGKTGREQHIKDLFKVSSPRFTKDTGKKQRHTRASGPCSRQRKISRS